jgi:hypothetical protein
MCGDRLSRSIERSCGEEGLDLAALFPGCSGASPVDLVGCLDAATRCRHCRLFDAAAGLGVHCDLVDDDVANRSCLPLD